jgi:hypothetical protein
VEQARAVYGIKDQEGVACLSSQRSRRQAGHDIPLQQQKHGENRQDIDRGEGHHPMPVGEFRADKGIDADRAGLQMLLVQALIDVSCNSARWPPTTRSPGRTEAVAILDASFAGTSVSIPPTVAAR